MRHLLSFTVKKKKNKRKRESSAASGPASQPFSQSVSQWGGVGKACVGGGPVNFTPLLFLDILYPTQASFTPLSRRLAFPATPHPAAPDSAFLRPNVPLSCLYLGLCWACLSASSSATSFLCLSVCLLAVEASVCVSVYLSSSKSSVCSVLVSV